MPCQNASHRLPQNCSAYNDFSRLHLSSPKCRCKVYNGPLNVFRSIFIHIKTFLFLSNGFWKSCCFANNAVSHENQGVLKHFHIICLSDIFFLMINIQEVPRMTISPSCISFSCFTQNALYLQHIKQSCMPIMD